jgi:hypothetical protein
MATRNQMSFVDRVLFLASIGAACAIVFGVALVTSAVIEEHGEPRALAIHFAGMLPGGHAVMR